MSVAHGLTGIEAISGELEDLQLACGTHIMARWTWLGVCARVDPTYEPLAVTVREADGKLAGAALLGTRVRAGLREFVALGHGPTDAAALPVRSPDVAPRLAAAVLAAVSAERLRPWRLVLRHLPAGDPVAVALAARARHARLVPDEVAPRLVLEAGKTRLRDYTSKQYVKNRRRQAERLEAEGVTAVIDTTTDRDEIAAALPMISAICRERDREMERRSIVDLWSGRFFPEIVTAHAARGEILLLRARIGEDLAGYALCLRDGDALRVWNCRFDPRWSTFGIGQLCRSALIEHGIETGAGSIDWLLGDEPYKASISNDRVAAEDLFASSHAVIGAATTLALRVRDQAREATEDDATPPTWVKVVRTIGKPLLGS
ncbi:hypothetical protein GCM10009836_46690 [Pseudonocardia ailaonensis]|uniref:BioF2-like acetyltransferase domain-containing protein n=1 Tax=Pseudonocardia ailaonensis TaxID=367279 RepID=A0ABN2NCF9_9PSEU